MKRSLHLFQGRVALFVIAALTGAPGLSAQAAPPPEEGAVGAGLILRQLDGVKRVLMIGAHPDDEDTSLLAAIARGSGAEAAYLSLNRGEGGQNLIGPEFHDGLGIVRTGELLAARRLDGGRQFFTRAYDFGFSKSASETFGYWSREEILHDVVWVVRTFRPQVIISVFSGTPADGHGQHQVAGQLAQEVFDVAADPNRFPEQLEIGARLWQPSKLYVNRRFNPEDATLRVPTGMLDPLLGRSHHQLAMESRSQHRSQDMGSAQQPGPRTSGVKLLKSAVEVSESSDELFTGIDTTLVGMTEELPDSSRDRIVNLLEAYRRVIQTAGESLDAMNPAKATAPLAEAVALLAETHAAVESSAPESELSGVLSRKSVLAQRALMATSSIVMEVRAHDDLVVPGEEIQVSFQLWNGGAFSIRNATPSLDLPSGWSATLVTDRGADGTRTVGPGEIAQWVYAVRIPEDAELSGLYYLRQLREGEMYTWPAESRFWGLPKDPPPVHGRLDFTLEGMTGESVEVSSMKPVEYVGVEQSFGEFRKPFLVVPALSVLLEPNAMAWPTTLGEFREVTVHLQSEAENGATGTVRLETPAGWIVEPAEISFELNGAGVARTVSFQVRPEGQGREGFHTLRAVATLESGAEYREGFELIDYPHIERVAQFHSAETTVSVFPVAIAENISVGYIMGTGDDGPTALRQMGFLVEELSPDQVMSGDFDRFDAIVLGVRVYEARSDLIAANDQLTQFVRDGGTVISQYNQYRYPAGGYAPYEISIARPHDRVTDENAAVTLLHPKAPVFAGPNEITEADFRSWIQERGLYFLNQWDEEFIPLMEMADPGEEPKRGALLIAEFGEGVYVYTGLAFFRQFPRGVPGAYRLFANLVSLNPEVWKAWADGVVFQP